MKGQVLRLAGVKFLSLDSMLTHIHLSQVIDGRGWAC